MGVGCELIQFVAYRVLFVIMSTNTEKKKSAVSEEGHVLTAYGLFLVESRASMIVDQRVLEIPFPK